MFIELHMLQNFAPSNLNRDDTNSPKDCEFGGYRRARISSQCLKRAIREEFERRELLPEENRAARSRRLFHQLVERFTDVGKDDIESQQVAIAAIQGIGVPFSRESNPDEPAHATSYLLYLADQEISRFVDTALKYWDELLKIGEKIAPVKDDAETGQQWVSVTGTQKLPRALGNELLGALDGGKASDLAMFGRMIADLPGKRVDAASQVAHAISTNRVAVEFDFYTAIDDFNPQEDTGAGMMGTIEFNSACFYRYANIDLNQLSQNLDGDEELTRATLEAFLKASVTAVPTGKQNSMAAQNPPSFVMVVARDSGLWSMANAFLDPVRPDGSSDLIDASIARLDQYWGQLQTMYGDDGIHGVWYISLNQSELSNLGSYNAGNFRALVEQAVAGAMPGGNGAGGVA